MADEPEISSEIALVHRTLIAYSRALTHFSTRGALEEKNGIVLCAGGTWIPMIANTAFRLESDVSPTELVGRADDFFGSLGRGYTVPVRDNGQDEDLRAACLAAGLRALRFRDSRHGLPRGFCPNGPHPRASSCATSTAPRAYGSSPR